MTWALALVRAFHYAAVAQMFGAALFAALVAGVAPKGRTNVARLDSKLATLQSGSAGAALLTWCAWFVLQAGTMISGANETSRASAWVTVLHATSFGHIWVLRLIVLTVCALLVVARRNVHGREHEVDMLVMLAAATALATLAGIGHAAADPGVTKLVHGGADALHALAAGAWLGMLLPLALVLRSRLERINAIVTRFSRIGLIAVATLVISGIVNSLYLVGSWPSLFGTRYGHLLCAKLALFVVMVGLALANRLRSTPRLARIGETSVAASATIARNASLEALLGVAVLTIVGVLGTQVPAAHDEVSWPFRFRVEWQARGLPSIVRAYPTTYAVSPTRYTAAAVARGSVVYATDCRSCHGHAGHGDGEGAAPVARKPADLTAAHVLQHPEGDLYWWITNGIERSAMPAFAGALDERSRWEVVQFVKTLAAGAVIRGNAVTAAIQAPEFTYQIGYGPQRSVPSTTKDTATLLVFYTLPRSTPRLTLLASDASDLRKLGIDVVAVPLHEDTPAAASEQAWSPLVASASPDVPKAYAQLNSAAADRDHFELLIDRDGLVRAVWHAGDAPGLLELLDRRSALLDRSLGPRPLAHHHAPAGTQ
jgi:putative copper export protein